MTPPVPVPVPVVPLAVPLPAPAIRGLHSSTFRLNLSALCGIGVHLGVVEGVFRRCRGV